MTRNETASGGRTSVRQHLAAAVVLLCGLLPGTWATATTEPHVTVREEAGVYHVAARFHVPEPRSIVLSVLTDYEQIPRFMPGVKTSIVHERSAGRALVEQEAVSRMMVFSKRVHLILEVHEEGDTVRFRDECGGSFTRYAGAWRLSQHDGQTLVTYELTAQPSFDVPEFLLKRLLRRDANQMIERLRARIAAQPAQTSPRTLR